MTTEFMTTLAIAIDDTFTTTIGFATTKTTTAFDRHSSSLLYSPLWLLHTVLPFQMSF
jgi:hypothetical protein